MPGGVVVRAVRQSRDIIRYEVELKRKQGARGRYRTMMQRDALRFAHAEDAIALVQ